MKIKFIPKLKCHQKWHSKILLYAALFLVMLNTSCSTTKCTLCDVNIQPIHNIELKKESQEKYQREYVSTVFPPIPWKKNNKKFDIYIIDSDNTQPFLLDDGEAKSDYIKAHLLKIDTVDIKYVFKNADSDQLVEVLTVKAFITPPDSNKVTDFCSRRRNAFKVELKGMLGARSFNNIPYALVQGNEPVMNKFIGFGEEGTKITMGAEIGLLAPIKTINDKHRIHLGLMSGIWPVDGGLFVPMAIHPRFSFNDVSSPLSGSCNAFSVFADLGTAYDVNADMDKFWTKGKGFNSYFWDCGFGVDLWKNKYMDLSIDLGYRVTTLALSSNNSNQEWYDCLAVQQPDLIISAYPQRRANQIFIRVGLTF